MRSSNLVRCGALCSGNPGQAVLSQVGGFPRNLPEGGKDEGPLLREEAVFGGALPAPTLTCVTLGANPCFPGRGVGRTLC